VLLVADLVHHPLKFEVVNRLAGRRATAHLLRRFVALVIRPTSKRMRLGAGDEEMSVVDPIAHTLHVVQQRFAIVPDTNLITCDEVTSLRRTVAAVVTVALGSVDAPPHLLARVVPIVLVVGIQVALRTA
jgi:hypothetical protein